MGPLQLKCLSSNVIILLGAANLLERINFPPALTLFDGPNTEIALLETWVRTPLGHGCFSMFSWGFVLTFVHVFLALDRSTSQQVSCQVFLLSFNGLITGGIISDHITTDTLEDRTNHL
jgi:hypothetical protein